MRTSLFIVLAALTTLSATPSYAGEDQFFGTLFGMTAGGLIGNQFGHGLGKDVATGIGVADGGWIGNDLGRAADNAHYSSYNSGTAYYGAPYASPAPASFYNDANGYQPNYVAPQSEQPVTFVYKSSAYCREVSQQIEVNGQMKEIYGTACLQRDGSWKVVQ